MFAFCVGKSAVSRRFLFWVFFPAAASVDFWRGLVPDWYDRGRVDGVCVCFEIQEERWAGIQLIFLKFCF
jgi:hypothetical protein